MKTAQRYEFYNKEYSTDVDRTTQTITMWERGGWSRTYKLTFKQLLNDAKEWEIPVDLNAPDAVLAEIGTNIILANEAVKHGLDPFQYIPKSENITDPKDKKILDKFEKLLTKYPIEKILNKMSDQSKDVLRAAFLKG